MYVDGCGFRSETGLQADYAVVEQNVKGQWETMWFGTSTVDHISPELCPWEDTAYQDPRVLISLSATVDVVSSLRKKWCSASFVFTSNLLAFTFIQAYLMLSCRVPGIHQTNSFIFRLQFLFLYYVCDYNNSAEQHTKKTFESEWLA